jgi:hypothetical protein
LRRKVSRVIAIVITITAIDLDYDPDKQATARDHLSTDIPALFGFPSPSTGVATRNNHVFRADAFTEFVRTLQKALREGRSSGARTELEVLPNAWWGIEGGGKVHVACLYLARSSAWDAQLPPETAAAIKYGNRSILQIGPFKHFP